MNWYLEVLRKYAVFGGRARRKEYWMFNLLHIIIIFVLMFIDVSAELPLSAIYMLAVFIPGWAVLVRRLHDTGRSGGWVFITIVPLIGGLILLFFLVQGGERGDNEYGLDPKAEGAFAA